MQTMHSSTGPNTLIMTDILHDDILSMNIVSDHDKHEQASQSGWLGLHMPSQWLVLGKVFSAVGMYSFY